MNVDLNNKIQITDKGVMELRWHLNDNEMEFGSCEHMLYALRKKDPVPLKRFVNYYASYTLEYLVAVLTRRGHISILN